MLGHQQNVLADSPAKKIIASIQYLGLLTDAIPKFKTNRWSMKIYCNDPSLVQATFYFKFYLFELMKKDAYRDQFIPWVETMARHDRLGWLRLQNNLNLCAIWLPCLERVSGLSIDFCRGHQSGITWVW